MYNYLQIPLKKDLFFLHISKRKTILKTKQNMKEFKKKYL